MVFMLLYQNILFKNVSIEKCCLITSARLVCSLNLILFFPLNNFSVMSGQSQLMLTLAGSAGSDESDGCLNQWTGYRV